MMNIRRGVAGGLLLLVVLFPFTPSKAQIAPLPIPTVSVTPLPTLIYLPIPTIEPTSVPIPVPVPTLSPTPVPIPIPTLTQPPIPTPTLSPTPTFTLQPQPTITVFRDRPIPESRFVPVPGPTVTRLVPGPTITELIPGPTVTVTAQPRTIDELPPEIREKIIERERQIARRAGLIGIVAGLFVALVGMILVYYLGWRAREERDKRFIDDLVNDVMLITRRRR